MNEFRETVIGIDISSLKEILEIGHFTLLVLFIGKRTAAGDVQRCVKHVWITGAMCSAANAVLLIKICFLFFSLENVLVAVDIGVWCKVHHINIVTVA